MAGWLQVKPVGVERLVAASGDTQRLVNLASLSDSVGYLADAMQHFGDSDCHHTRNSALVRPSPVPLHDSTAFQGDKSPKLQRCCSEMDSKHWRGTILLFVSEILPANCEESLQCGGVILQLHLFLSGHPWRGRAGLFVQIHASMIQTVGGRSVYMFHR